MCLSEYLRQNRHIWASMRENLCSGGGGGGGGGCSDRLGGGVEIGCISKFRKGQVTLNTGLLFIWPNRY